MNEILVDIGVLGNGLLHAFGDSVLLFVFTGDKQLCSLFSVVLNVFRYWTKQC